MEERRYSKMLIPSILSVSVLTIMAPTAVSPALAAIRDAFPGISATQAKLVLTLPTLVMMPMGLLSARLTARIDKKRLLLTGMVLFLVFGVAGGFVNDFRLLLLMRLLFGVGLGIMTPLSTSLIFDFAPDPGKRSKLLGLQGSSNQLGGLIFMSLSGVLASMSWRYSFLVYAFVIVSIILTLNRSNKIIASPIVYTRGFAAGVDTHVVRHAQIHAREALDKCLARRASPEDIKAAL